MIISIILLAFNIEDCSSASPTRTSTSLGLNYGHYHSSSSSSISPSRNYFNSNQKNKKKQIPSRISKNYRRSEEYHKYNQILHNNLNKMKDGCVYCLSMIKHGIDRSIEETSKCISKPPPLFILQSIYWLTAADAAHCVLMNDYTSTNNIKVFFQAQHSTKKHGGVQIISLFARVRPRLLFSVGSLLRALQVVTPLQRIFDPTIGVGAGINICAMIAGSRWVKPLILGWTITKWAWLWLGARPPDHVHVPIVLSIRELERHKKEP